MPDVVRIGGRRMSSVMLSTAVLCLTSVALLVLTLATWQPDNNPRPVIVGMLVTSCLALGWTLVRGSRLGERDVAVIVALAFLGLSGLSLGTERDLAAFSNGTSIPMLSIYAVWFLPLAVTRLIAYPGTVLWAGAVATHDEPTLLLPSLSIGIQVVIATEIFGRIRGRLDRLARTDDLTGALNRRGTQDLVAVHLARRARLGTPLTVLALDADGLRAINNRDGHAAGDALLVAAADHLRRRQRTGDVLGRLGGDEFLVVLPGADHGVGDVVARRIAADSPVSWSIGVAEARASDDVASLLARADARMYGQKQRRRAVPSAAVSEVDQERPAGLDDRPAPRTAP